MLLLLNTIPLSIEVKLFHLTDIYHRSIVGEYLVFLSVPIIIIDFFLSLNMVLYWSLRFVTIQFIINAGFISMVKVIQLLVGFLGMLISVLFWDH